MQNPGPGPYLLSPVLHYGVQESVFFKKVSPGKSDLWEMGETGCWKEHGLGRVRRHMEPFLACHR